MSRHAVFQIQEVTADINNPVLINEKSEKSAENVIFGSAVLSIRG